jgi:hypothetical protein
MCLTYALLATCKLAAQQLLAPKASLLEGPNGRHQAGGIHHCSKTSSRVAEGWTYAAQRERMRMLRSLATCSVQSQL